jgi:hypothetical protein
LVVLAHSQARRDSALFGEVKCLFSTAPEAGKETEANGDHCGDRTLHRTRSRLDQCVRSVHSVSAPRVSDRTLVWPDQCVRSVHLCAEAERATGESGPSWDRRVRSGVQRRRAQRSDDRTRGASGHVRSDASGRAGSLLDSDRTPGRARLVTLALSRLVKH